MDGKVVQLVQGKEKALEGEAPLVMLEKFSAFPVIQVIDLDAAIGAGSKFKQHAFRQKKSCRTEIPTVVQQQAGALDGR